MTTPTTPDQARELANWSKVPIKACDALRSLAQQVEELTKERDVFKQHAALRLDQCGGLLRMEVEAVKANAERYQKIRAGTRVQRGSCFEQIWFVLPEVKPIPGVNIQNGNVAQHLDAAIDAAMKAES